MKLAIAAEDSLLIADVASGNIDSELVHDGNVTDLAWSPSGLQLATACSDGYLRVVDFASNWVEHAVKVSNNEINADIGHMFHAVAWCPSGRKLAAGCSWESLCIIDATSGVMQQQMNWSLPIDGVSWSPSGTRVGVACLGEHPESIFIVDTVTGDIERTLDIREDLGSYGICGNNVWH